MSLKDIEEQERLADELHQKIYGNPEVKVEAAAPPAQPAPATEQQAAPAQVEPVKNLKAPPEKENDPEYWRNRAQILAGKYESEVPRYAQENRTLKEELARLQAASAQPAEAASTQTPELPSDLIEKYGEDFVTDLRTIAGAQPQQQVPDGITEKLDRLERTMAEERYEKFKAKLSEKAPAWESLNNDSTFITWLAGIDPLSGRPRQEMLDDAHSSLDVQRVANFFNSFNGDQSWDGQQGNAFTPPPLAEQLTPNSSKANSPQMGKKVWNVGEITQFYDDLRRGRVSDADATRIENDIFAAQKEGRVR